MTKQERAGIELVNELSASFLKAFPDASPQFKAQFKPLRISRQILSIKPDQYSRQSKGKRK